MGYNTECIVGEFNRQVSTKVHFKLSAIIEGEEERHALKGGANVRKWEAIDGKRWPRIPQQADSRSHHTTPPLLTMISPLTVVTRIWTCAWKCTRAKAYWLLFTWNVISCAETARMINGFLGNICIQHHQRCVFEWFLKSWNLPKDKMHWLIKRYKDLPQQRHNMMQVRNLCKIVHGLPWYTSTGWDKSGRRDVDLDLLRFLTRDDNYKRP